MGIEGKDGRKQLGAWGERIAANHLRAKGYDILHHNWRCSRGEIDLVAQAGAELVFVEVKTRRGRAMGTPEEGMTPHKARKLLELAQHYLYQHDLDEIDWRIDLVAVELDAHGKFLRCDHIPDLVLGW
jgi:putative endonuclease